MQPDATTINRVAEWRRKMNDGTITLEDMKEAIIVLRQSRSTATPTAKHKATKAPKVTKSGDDLLSELDF